MCFRATQYCRSCPSLAAPFEDQQNLERWRFYRCKHNSYPKNPLHGTKGEPSPLNPLETESECKLKLCLVASAGGHLEQLNCLRPLYQQYEHTFIMAEGESAAGLLAESSIQRIPNVNEGKGIRNPLLLLRAVHRSLRILSKTKPAVVLSTGSGVAFPVFVAAFILRKKRIYVESFARISRPSKSGRACYPLSSLFLIQHRALARYYPKAVYCGPLYKAL